MGLARVLIVQVCVLPIAKDLTELHFAPDQTNLNIAKDLTEYPWST